MAYTGRIMRYATLLAMAPLVGATVSAADAVTSLLRKTHGIPGNKGTAPNLLDESCFPAFLRRGAVGPAASGSCLRLHRRQGDGTGTGRARARRGRSFVCCAGAARGR